MNWHSRQCLAKATMGLLIAIPFAAGTALLTRNYFTTMLIMATGFTLIFKAIYEDSELAKKNKTNPLKLPEATAK